MKYNDGLESLTGSNFQLSPAKLHVEFTKGNANAEFALSLGFLIVHNTHALLMTDTRRGLLDMG